MRFISDIRLAFKSLLQLGVRQTGLYALYQVGLRTGYIQRQLTSSLRNTERLSPGDQGKSQACLAGLPGREILLEMIGTQVNQLLDEADEIVGGHVRLFGGPSTPLILSPARPLEDWTRYEKGSHLFNDEDIKLIWEPGRFGWACKLAMAYYLSGNERYAETFWQNTGEFFNSNPPYLGPHWSSAQEVAIRLVALVFSLQIFTQTQHTTSERLDRIVKTIAIHAERIPPTMVYARSQNNNHLITEALGLYTASAVLPSHPRANKWHALGWKWLKNAIISQISADGTYVQHSTNYHRLMLQAALWAHAVHDYAFINERMPDEYSSRLASATNWLRKMVDPKSGRVPNLGHNDGAYILPLTVCSYDDYRPVIHSAARAFLQTNLVPDGPWDDMAAWFCLPLAQAHKETDWEYWHQFSQRKDIKPQSPYILVDHSSDSWATIRVGRFHSRPAHADQLHVDLWWRGCNLAQDPGTYLYNSSPPWDNSLTSALVHNTVVVDGNEFMRRAGRFLYLDWAQARILEYQSSPGEGFKSITAEHNGYRKVGIIHSRKITTLIHGHWEIIDHLEGSPGIIHTARLHWLLPDWDFLIPESSGECDGYGCEVRIRSPHGWVSLKMGTISEPGDDLSTDSIKLTVARAGEVLTGQGLVLPIHGWISPTYGVKKPALAVMLDFTHALPIKLKCEWILPCEV